jgi:hypothetical protein
MRAVTAPRLDWATDVDSWMDDGACLGWHPKAYHRGVSEEFRRSLEWVDLSENRAKEVCNECPIRTQCLERAMVLEESNALWGVWGATTPRERRQLLAQRRKAQGPLVIAVDKVDAA